MRTSSEERTALRRVDAVQRSKRSIKAREHVSYGDFNGRTGEHVSAQGSAPGQEHSASLEIAQYVVKVRFRDFLLVCDLGSRNGTRRGILRQVN